MQSFSDFFQLLAGSDDAGAPLQPRNWQADLVSAPPRNALIRIPTGFGKTLGVLAAWLWHRVNRAEEDWPRRLVWCLPMRVLVEQTRDVAERALRGAGLLWNEREDHHGKVGVHLLMGGADCGDWALYPEHSSILIGTQDMLLSRALNRGYGTPRARWPMEFGLLNQDCLWVMDEVQLMDVGLATSAQLQAFRADDERAKRTLRPCFTWWMSATLQVDWLRKSPDTQQVTARIQEAKISPPHRVGHLWDDITKPLTVTAAQASEAKIAELVAELHQKGGCGKVGPTVAVLNTVERATKVWRALRDDESLGGTDVRLVHSRFRPVDRSTWRQHFLNRPACAPGTDRIIVSTQVIEAGVDLSAGVLVTELAPWANLVQRFGRCARWGGSATVVVVDLPAARAAEAVENADARRQRDSAKGKKPKPVDEAELGRAAELKVAAPYNLEQLHAARQALALLTDVAPFQLEAFEEAHDELLPALYPFDPLHVLLRHELDELFDTTPDLSGADVDISRFIRTGEERDLHVFWAEVPGGGGPDDDLEPTREALCAVPFLKARDWLCGSETAGQKAPGLKKGIRAWVWDWQEGAWTRPDRRDLYPGQLVAVSADCGGYKPDEGWSPDSLERVEPVSAPLADPEIRADSAQSDESLSAQAWKTIATHGTEVGREARRVARDVAPSFEHLLDLAGRCHDIGKRHEAFDGSIKADWPGRPARHDLAKAPRDAWLPKSKIYAMSDGSRRPGFRHELATALALFAVLQRYAPDHEALLGPWRELLEHAGARPAAQVSEPNTGSPSPLESEILALDARSFDLLAYLACAHHGKVRVAWHLGPADQQAADGALRIRGIRDGDVLGPVFVASASGAVHELPASALDLAPASAGLNARTGRGWTERVLGLLDQYGPFTLAWLEALLRAADQRASRLQTPDPLLANEPMEGGRP